MIAVDAANAMAKVSDETCGCPAARAASQREGTVTRSPRVETTGATSFKVPAAVHSDDDERERGSEHDGGRDQAAEERDRDQVEEIDVATDSGQSGDAVGKQSEHDGQKNR